MINPRRKSYAELVALFTTGLNPQNLIHTHFSARFQNKGARPRDGQANSINILLDETIAVFSNQLYLAEDFQRYKIEKDSRLIKIDEK